MPSFFFAPRPRTRNVRPLGVPDGILSVTGAPPRVGIFTSAPSAASSKETGTSRVRLSSLRPKSRCGVTLTVTNRSPAGPPPSPWPPLPRSRIRCPSFTPAGMRAWMVRAEEPRPLPWQVGHGSSYTSWRPWQVGHVSLSEKAPPTPDTTKPAPSHVAQMCGLVPGLPPVPLHCGQGASEVSRRLIVTPSTESVNPMVAVDSTSEPRTDRAPRVCWRCPRPLVPPPPKMSPNMSPRPPEWPRMTSSMSNPPGGRNPPNPPGNGPLATCERYSSYLVRFSASPRTS